ncbi:hypothetical protein Y032_0005g2533 [Ancylostoma ceylanicum]|uniref:Uncharacterized protein n=1 Tax=Ancylostoma ceylanicum TaxID=53326 RepID=A0A016VT59_9BILA|nr:hypothetical protein Y032_0005g2533 [Ancylostoma ceylanicum]
MAGIRSSTLRQQSKIRDAAVYAKLSKIRWAGHVMRLNDYHWTRAVSDWTDTVGREPSATGWIAGARSVYPTISGSRGD